MKKTVFVMVAVLLSAAMAKDIDVRQGTHLEPFMARPMPVAFRPSITKTPGHYSKTDWRQAIDSVWGPGLPTQEKLDFLDAWWNLVSDSFACFNNLPLTYDSLDAIVARYRAEVEDTVSWGRFAGILCQMNMLLMECHTGAEDIHVCQNTDLLPGVPLQVIGDWSWDRHFGAGLTALEDSTLVVYVVEDSIPHPLGLRPGDIILGYDGRPWPELCQELREAELPLHRWWRWGSKPETMTYSLLIGAGLNWHLFDTIDIKKWPSDSVVHLPTSLMVGYEPRVYLSEQMDIPGVPKPDLSLLPVTYGVMEHRDTAIGYIYAWNWVPATSALFQEACSVLVSDDNLKGIIIDYRYNEGGYFPSSRAGHAWLFRDSCNVLDACQRTDPVDPYGMTRLWTATIQGNGTGYGKPVAVLIGPACGSAGDYAAYAATLLDAGPVRTFGRSTNGAHIGGYRTPQIHGDFFTFYAYLDTRKCDDTTYYMTHRGFEPDTVVWHDRDSVALGRDAVVTAAAEWILSIPAVSEPRVGTPMARSLPTVVRGVLLLPRDMTEVPGNWDRVPRPVLLDAAGRKVMDLVPGENDVRHLAPGVYFCRQTAGSASSAQASGVMRDASSVAKIVVTR